MAYEEFATSDLVAERLQRWGYEVHRGLGGTGVVGTLRQGSSTRRVGLRADMDALPIEETTAKPWASKVFGKMHACGHDGHTAMLLGAAKYLAETRNFDGSVVVIFQPAEEGGGGGDEMVRDGMMDRWNVQEVYGMHNMPGLPLGSFAIRPGAFFAATDQFEIVLEGKGGHAAKPQETVDTTVLTSHLVLALQTIASRNVDPTRQIVVSVTSFETDTKAFNVIPQRATLRGTVRTLDQDTRALAEQRLVAIATQTAQVFGGKADVNYMKGYPVMVNSETETDYAAAAAKTVAGACAEAPLIMGGEDFAYMLESRPGAYILVGNGDTAMVHHPEYNFDDEAIPAGASWWVEIAESRMPI
jgi:hippurate hydrolase